MDYEEYHWDANDFVDDCFDAVDRYCDYREEQERNWNAHEDYLGYLKSEEEYEYEQILMSEWEKKDFLYYFYIIFKQHCQYTPPSPYNGPETKHEIFERFMLKCISKVREFLGEKKYFLLLEYLIWKREHPVQFCFMFNKIPGKRPITLKEIEERIDNWQKWNSTIKYYTSIIKVDSINSYVHNRMSKRERLITFAIIFERFKLIWKKNIDCHPTVNKWSKKLAGLCYTTLSLRLT